MSNFDEPSPSVPPPPMVSAAGAPVPQTSGMAVASLVLGIVSCVTFCLCFGGVSIPCGVIAIVLSRHAAADAKAGRVGPGGNSMAAAGKVCGIVGLCLCVVYLVVFVGYAILAMAAGSFT